MPYPSYEVHPVSPRDCRAAVAEAAYYKWLAAGQPQGQDLEFWLSAEHEVAGNCLAPPAHYSYVMCAEPIHKASLCKELHEADVGSRSEIAELNRGPEHQIDTYKLRALDMTFCCQPLLRRTLAELVEAHRQAVQAFR
jgi:hypothetical protein